MNFHIGLPAKIPGKPYPVRSAPRTQEIRPGSSLPPVDLPLCVIGAFAVHLNYIDVYVMFIAGIVGYVLHRFGFPLAPMVLAVILGPLADENLRRALLTFEGKSIWFVLQRPIGTVLILIVLFTFYDGIFRRGKAARK
ncbi:tripartite tricarboxylate transporter permease [Nitrospinota bacterium]